VHLLLPFNFADSENSAEAVLVDLASEVLGKRIFTYIQGVSRPRTRSDDCLCICAKKASAHGR